MDDKLPKLLLKNYRKWGDTRVAMRKKELGFWKEYTGKDFYEKPKYFLRVFLLSRFSYSHLKEYAVCYC